MWRRFLRALLVIRLYFSRDPVTTPARAGRSPAHLRSEINKPALVFACVGCGVITLGPFLLLWWANSRDQAAFMPFLGLSCFIIGLFLYKSIFYIDAGEGLETYLFSSHWRTYVSDDFMTQLRPQALRNRRLKARKIDLRRGWCGGFLFLPWPFWRVIRFPTDGVTIFLHTGKIFTKKSSGSSYRVMMEAAPTFVIHFMTIRGIVSKFSVPRLIRYLDLTQKGPVGEGTHKYEDYFLAKIILDDIAELVMEAVRDAAAYFSFDGEGNDIIEEKELFEMTILFHLAERESRLWEAKVLKRPKDTDGNEYKTVDACQKAFRELKITLEDFVGLYVAAKDLNLEGISFERVAEGASPAESAVNTAYQGLQEGQREKEKLAKAGEGRAAAVTALRNAGKIKGVGGKADVDMPPEIAVAADALKGSPLTVNVWGGGAQDALKQIIGGFKSS